MDKLEKVTVGAVAGMLAAVAPAWSRWDDDNQRRAADTRDRANNANYRITDLINRGELVRLRIPAVMDALVGLGLANPMKLFPDVLPSNVTQQRPDLFSDTRATIEEISWPPKVGTYTDKGLTAEAGELATLFLGFTFEEVRCVVQSLVQAKQPTSAQKVQIYRAINALIAALYNSNLSYEQFVQLWTRLFDAAAPGGSSAANSTINPHHDPALPPTIANHDTAVASVVALGAPDLVGYPYAHQNTDHAMKWRLTTAGNVPALTTLCTIRFGTPYTRSAMPYQPIVTASHPLLFAANITRSTVDIKCISALALGLVVDFGLTTTE